MRWVPALEYMLSSMRALAFVRQMSVPAFKAAVLAMLIQKVEALEGESWSLRSLPGWFGGATRPVL
jgi:hypothetical protein